MTLARWLLEPSDAVQDPDQRRRSRLLLRLLLPLTLLALAAALATPSLLPPAARAVAHVSLGSGVLLAACVALARTRHVDLAAAAVVAVTGAGAWAAFVAGRAEAASPLYLAFLGVSVVLSGVLLAPASTLVLGSLHVAGIVALPLLVEGVPDDVVVPTLLYVLLLTALVAASGVLRASEARSRREAEARLLAREESYRALVENSPDAIVVHSEGRIVYANEAAERLFAAPPGRLLGLRPLEDLVHPDYREVVAERVRRIEVEGQATTPLDIVVRRLDGGDVEVDVMGAPAVHEGRRADQTILRDVTARREAERAVREIQRLEEASAMKTQLLNVASHELNTPIAALKLQLHLLKAAAPADEPRRAKALDLLDRNVQRLARLVADVLDVARMESGHLRLRPAPADVAQVVRDAADFYEEAARQAGLRLAVDAPAPLPADADAERLSQVVMNLLSNALKFAPAGTEVRVEARAEGGIAVVRVRDQGAGLSKEQMARLFQAFSQVHDEHAHQGTGLGLHISRGIVEGHGGRMWCESDGPGRGATFAFSVPLTAVAAAR